MIFTTIVRDDLRDLARDEFGDDFDLVAILDRVAIGTELVASPDADYDDETNLPDHDRILLAIDYYFGNFTPATWA